MDHGVPAFLVAVPAERMTPGHYRDPKRNLIAEKALDDLNNFMFVGAKPATLVKHRVGTPARMTPTSPNNGWKSLVVSPQELYGGGAGGDPTSPAAAPGTLELLNYDPSRGEMPPLSDDGGEDMNGDDGEERSRKIRKTMSDAENSTNVSGGGRSHSSIIVPMVERQQDENASVHSELASATLESALNDNFSANQTPAATEADKQSVRSSEVPHEGASGTTTSQDTDSASKSVKSDVTAPMKPKAAAKPPAPPPSGNKKLYRRGSSTGSLARRASQGSVKSKATEIPAPSPLFKLEGETARIPDGQEWSKPLYRDLEHALVPYSSLGYSPSTVHGSPHPQGTPQRIGSAMDRYRTQRADTSMMRQMGARRHRNSAPQDLVLDGFALLGLAQAEIPDDVYAVNMNDRGYHDIVQEDLEEFTELQKVVAGINNFDFDMFSPLKKLQILHLPCNNLSHITIPAQSFTNIRELQLAFNNLNGMDTIRALLHGLPKLETLNLADNNISRLPEDSLRNVTSLRTLILDHNHLNSNNCPFTALSQLPNLQVLSLERNNISTVPRPACNQGFKALFTLNLCHNRIYHVQDATATSRIKSLLELFLWGNPMAKFDDLCGEHLAKNFSRRQNVHIHVIDPEAEFSKAPYRPLSASQILERRGRRFQDEDQQLEEPEPSENNLDHLTEVQAPPPPPPPPGPQVHGRVDSLGKVSRDEIDNFKKTHSSPKRMPDSFSMGHSIYKRGGGGLSGSSDDDDASPREKKVEVQRSVFLTAINNSQEIGEKDEAKPEVKMHSLFKKRASVPIPGTAKPKKTPTTSSLKIFKKMAKVPTPPLDPDRPPSPLKASEDLRGTSPPPQHTFNRAVEKRATVPFGETPKTAIPRVMVRKLAGVEEQKKTYEFKNGYSFNREWTRKECTCCNMFDPESENHYTEAEVNKIFNTLDHYVEKGRNLKVIKDPFKEFGEELRVMGDESDSDDEAIQRRKKEFKQSNLRQMEFGVNALQRTKIIHKRGNIAERDRMHEMEVAWVKSRKTGPMPEPIRNIVEKMQDRLVIAELQAQDKKDSELEQLFLESQAAFLGREFPHGIKNTPVHPSGPPSVENTEPRDFQRERRSVTSLMPAIANLRGRPKI